MIQYLKLFKNHDEYELSSEKPCISHCIEEVHVHFDNTYNFGSLDEVPCVGDEYTFEGRYYYPSNVSEEDCYIDGTYY